MTELHPSGASVKRRRRLPRPDFYKWLGDQLCGSPVPPGSTQHLDFIDKMGLDWHISTSSNDGFWLSIGYGGETKVDFWDNDARRVAWFILWKWWAKSTWFGLKRALWYRLLHRRVRQTAARWDHEH